MKNVLGLTKRTRFSLGPKDRFPRGFPHPVSIGQFSRVNGIGLPSPEGDAIKFPSVAMDLFNSRVLSQRLSSVILYPGTVAKGNIELPTDFEGETCVDARNHSRLDTCLKPSQKGT